MRAISSISNRAVFGLLKDYLKHQDSMTPDERKKFISSMDAEFITGSGYSAPPKRFTCRYCARACPEIQYVCGTTDNRQRVCGDCLKTWAKFLGREDGSTEKT